MINHSSAVSPLLLSCAAALLIGCGESAPDIEGPLVPLRSEATSLSLAAAPSVRVGNAPATPALEFDARNGFLGAIAMADGGLIVLDGVRVTRFDASGGQQWSVGAMGRGPGEFASVVSACTIPGDTLMVFDMSERRLSVVAPEGSIVKAEEMSAFGFMQNAACLVDGTVMFLAPTSRTAEGSVAAVVRTVNTDFALVDSVTTLPLTTSSQVASILSSGSTIWSADPTRRELQVWGLNGKVQQAFSLSEPDVTLSESDAAMAQAVVPAAGSDVSAPPAPTQAPYFTEAQVDVAGRLWLRSFTTDREAPAEWVGVTTDGELAGRFTVPDPSAQLAAVTREGIWLLRRDGTEPASFDFYPFSAALP